MKIFIDAGHGGSDSGAVANGLQEKNTNLILALMLESELKNYKCEVMQSRTGDVNVDLDIRPQLANQWGADLFISLHSNAHSNDRANGYEDFIHDSADERTRNIRVVAHREIAKVWASENRTVRGMKAANFAVLRGAKMPAMLIENGFLTNGKDAELLKNNSFLEKLTSQTAKGVAMAIGLQSIGKKEHWAKKHFEYLTKEKGLTIHEERFDDTITRGEMFAMLARVMGYDESR